MDSKQRKNKLKNILATTVINDMPTPQNFLSSLQLVHDYPEQGISKPL
jgi:hypothetical protein